MVKFEEFRRDIVGLLRELCGPEVSIEEVTALKNNSVRLYGVSIKGMNTNVAPTVYLESYYEQYYKGKLKISQVVDNIISVYRKSRMKGFA